ncbi:MAG: dihydrodipicolinate synthase family protein [Verrucomicrobiota bacterium]
MSKRCEPVMLATAVLPWNESYELEEECFRKELRFLFRQVTPHVYIFGTAGEGYAITDKQFATILPIFWEEAQANAGKPMVGFISLSLGTMIERMTAAYDFGFRRFQFSLPSWGALNDRELDLFFRETCGRFTDCEFTHYNLKRSGRLLTGRDYARLATAHPNLVAAKLSGKDSAYLRDCLVQAKELQFFITDPGYALMRDEFECGLLASLALCHLEMGRQFFTSRGTELHKFGKEIDQLLELICQAVGPDSHMDGAYDKLIYKLHDPDFPLRLLPPYLAPEEDRFHFFRDHLPANWRTNLNQINL